jgi:violaxanthin de-epoxidase
VAATDGAAIGKCLLQNCQIPLARCITNPTCLTNLACIQTCTNRPDEAECQIKCGDEFSNDVVGDFTKCAVTDKGCVPQRPDDGSWPVPKDEVLVQKFTTEALEGDWYISAGLNKAFDTFDCQLHKFTAPSPRKLVGNLQWRIKDPVAGTAFVTRYTVQEFEMDATRQGILYNHDNDFLHYQDDWYILAAADQKYVVVYYRGNNDAWDGYGGAVVYTRAPAFPKEYVPEVKAAVEKVGLKWEDFVLTDNTCKARESRLDELEQDLVFVESRAANGLQLVGKSVAKEVVKDVVAVEREIVKDVVIVEKEVVKDVVKVEKEIEKDLVAVEQEVERDVKGFFGGLFGK